MAKKKTPRKAKPASTSANGKEKVNKSQAIRDYLMTNKSAMPKEIVAALKEKGIEVSPNMVSMIKAKAKVKRARRQAKEAVASHNASAGKMTSNSAALDSALVLYKAACGQEVSSGKVRQSFLLLVETLG